MVNNMVKRKKKLSRSARIRKQTKLKKKVSIKKQALTNKSRIIEKTKKKNNEGSKTKDIIKVKRRKPTIVFWIIIIIASIGLIYSIINIIISIKAKVNTDSQIGQIQDVIEVQDVEDDDTTEIINNNVEVEEDNPYWDYIKMNLINVDFTDLRKTNSDVVGWIKINGTNINYPVVQTNDNDYYLSHSFDKSDNSAGWVFMDYRNNYKDLDKNTIIYAHGRVDKTMFGSLKNILTSNWINDTDNYIVKTSNGYENDLWQVFSVYSIPTTSDYLLTKFNNDNEFFEFANMLIARSNYNFNTDVSKDDKILTLSTCMNDSKKVVLHAKLIKTQKSK